LPELAEPRGSEPAFVSQQAQERQDEVAALSVSERVQRQEHLEWERT
jgi:hypothetical protein